MMKYPTDSENDEARFQDVENSFTHERYMRYVLYFVLFLFFIFCTFVGFDSFALNYGYAGSCYDSPSDALAFFEAQFPIVSGLNSYSISNVSLSSSTITYTLSSLDITTGLQVVYSPVTVLLSDCVFHYSVAQINLALGLVMLAGLGLLAGISYIR